MAQDNFSDEIRRQLSDESRLQKARQSLARLVCNHKEVPPLLFMDQKGSFMSLVEGVNPYFHRTISFDRLQQDCLNIYEEERKKVHEVFSGLSGRISISVDSLVLKKSRKKSRSRGEYEDHFSVIAHFVDNDWMLKKWVIKHSVDKIDTVGVVLGALNEWNVEGKVLSLTGDSYVSRCVKEAVQGRRELVLDGRLFEVQSYCDVVSQMAESVFKMIENIIDKVKLLRWYKPLPLWYLTTSNLKTALKLQNSGEFDPENIEDFYEVDDYEVPSEEEWGKVRNVCRITDRIHEITKPLFHAKKQTANLFLPHVVEIHSYLVQESGSSDEFVKAVANKMLETYSKYLDESYLVLSVAAFLDPRYKMSLIEYSSSKLQCVEKTAHVLETIKKIYDSYAVKNDENDECVLSDSSSESEDEGFEDEEPDEEYGDLMEILDSIKEFRVKFGNDQRSKSDLEMYLDEPVVPWIENFSVLRWWKRNCAKYPQLSMMARDFLAVPMSVATSHEAYYTETRPAVKSVASLQPKFVNALMCVRSWNFGKDGCRRHQR